MARPDEKLALVVVFPTPPLPDVTTTMRVIWFEPLEYVNEKCQEMDAHIVKQNLFTRLFPFVMSRENESGLQTLDAQGIPIEPHQGRPIAQIIVQAGFHHAIDARHRQQLGVQFSGENASRGVPACARHSLAA